MARTELRQIGYLNFHGRRVRGVNLVATRRAVLDLLIARPELESHADIADMIGCSRSTFSRLVSGSTSVSLFMGRQIIEGLGMNFANATWEMRPEVEPPSPESLSAQIVPLGKPGRA